MCHIQCDVVNKPITGHTTLNKTSVPLSLVANVSEFSYHYFGITSTSRCVIDICMLQLYNCDIYQRYPLTHWGRVMHICVGKQTNIGAVQATSHYLNQCWNIVNLGTHFSEISIKILTFSFTKMRLTVSSAKWCPFCHLVISSHDIYYPK